MKTIISSLVFLAISLCVTAQNYNVHQIDSIIKGQLSNSYLDTLVLNPNNVFESTFDGSGEIVLIHQNGSLIKYELHIINSTGRFNSEIYYLDSIPLKIIEVEEIFNRDEGQASLDYTKLKIVFSESIYIKNWLNGDTYHEVDGERIFSEASCGIFELEPDVELGLKLLKQNL